MATFLGWLPQTMLVSHRRFRVTSDCSHEAVITMMKVLAQKTPVGTRFRSRQQYNDDKMTTSRHPERKRPPRTLVWLRRRRGCSPLVADDHIELHAAPGGHSTPVATVAIFVSAASQLAIPACFSRSHSPEFGTRHPPLTFYDILRSAGRDESHDRNCLSNR